MAPAAPAERIAGRLERLVWEREARDRALAYPTGGTGRATAHPAGFWFDDAAADHVLWFIETLCRHHKGEWAGQLLELQPWQRDLLRIAFGWMRPDGTRRYRILYVEIPRKNGKSELAAALGLYLLAADREPGAEVYSSATKKDQAKIVHDTAIAMVKKAPELKRFVRSYRNNLHCERLGSKFEPLGADSQTLDGLNPHGNIVDELHAHRDRKVWDVLDTAMGARRQPMTIAITTAGTYEPESIGWLQHQHAVHVLTGVVQDDAFCAFVAAADEQDDWTLPATWAKANPNYDVSVKPSYLEAQAEKAKTQPSFLNTFLRLHLNQWTQQRERWIPIETWNASDADCSRAEVAAREVALLGTPCFGGLDLSTKIDVTAFALYFPEAHDVVMRFYCPEAKILQRSHRDRVPYDAWVRDGWMVATPGEVIDYAFIRRDVLDIAARFGLQEIAYDPWNATQLATQLTEDGIVMVELRQGYKSLSEPSKEFEALVASKRLRHMGNPVLRWMVANVGIRRDANENIAPDKAASADRIDGVVATIMALARGSTAPSGTSKYESDDLLIL